MQTSRDLSPEDYNEEVYYCKSCHSLCVVVDESISGDDWDGCFCGKCYSADIGICAFGDWLKEEERRAAKRREIEWSK